MRRRRAIRCRLGVRSEADDHRHGLPFPAVGLDRARVSSRGTSWLSRPGGLGFQEACATEDARERVVGLVTGVLVDARVGRRPDVLATPRLCPHRRVVDRELIEERLGINPREALDDMQVPRCPAARITTVMLRKMACSCGK